MKDSSKLVIECIAQVLRENGEKVPKITERTVILEETGLDSLGLATVVVRIEEKTAKDPFKKGFIAFRTVGELARLYEG